MTSKIDSIIREWKTEAQVKHVILWGYDYDDAKLVIMTDHPGAFIGMRGERHNRFQEKLIEASKKTGRLITGVKYIESKGIC